MPTLLTTPATTDSMDTVVSATDKVVEFTSKVFDLITGNPVLVVFLAASLIGVGISVFRKLKGAAH